MNVNKTRYSIYNLNYHIAWIPKYRKKLFTGQMELRLGEIIRESCIRNNISILALEIMPDHIHLFISAPPRWSPSEIVNIIKGYSSRKMRQEFLQLKKIIKDELWTRTYFIGSAGTVTSETIRKYIAEQKNL
ncbi:MAG: IS200/IS605 family transposase [Candidatus Omnitrophica bacterium CG08_land_8_20_14_0_20_41_16]|uniref:IS200/IS605 family transposase n=1 Tax=Candidatus Sherwoodlollariibacterium unditelluris TaxID=1974757 RepID=A0A2G9YL02_9BACT|nr:MAG: IS200/IS605 family transposase [Candidatus Omnitrophica bacterium CG23_combo_of_CG06-09_8_20_14_all_41_10]PIS33936.1 MAG: IS200/IS605 family transposase [Candidatus Omnitrophica bacterium CG08_land_8_20_14_0_20_41_16]